MVTVSKANQDLMQALADLDINKTRPAAPWCRDLQGGYELASLSGSQMAEA
jgi:hypothetical protein